MSLGERIKIERERRMLTQNQLAKKSGVPQSTISRLETGDVSDLRFEPVVKLARELGVSIDSLASVESRHDELARVITDGHARDLLRLFDCLSASSRELLVRFAEFLNLDDDKRRELFCAIEQGQAATDLARGSVARAHAVAARASRREPLVPRKPIGLAPEQPPPAPRAPRYNPRPGRAARKALKNERREEDKK